MNKNFLTKLFVAIFTFISNTKAETVGSCGEGCTWEKVGTTLTVTGTGEGATMSNLWGWDWNSETMTYETKAPWGLDVTSINVTGTLTNIASQVFAGMKKVTTLTMDNSVESIGNHAFYGMSGLQNITLSDSLKTIGVGAFAWVHNLKNLTIPASVTDIENAAFMGMYLSSLVIEGTPKIKGDEAFAYNQSAKIYCQKGVDCQSKGAEDAQIITYEKKGKRYALENGKQFLSLGDMQSGKEFIAKRIYTVEEARKASKDTGNTLMLKYK